MDRKYLCGSETTVRSTAGLLRGFWFEDCFRFYGVKYADARRFQRPLPVQPWEGVRDALGYGYVSPMLGQDVPGAGELRVPHRYWPMDENCQYLNIWTPSLESGKKRPVLVWIHGGGFVAGSSIEQIAYDGANLCKYGDAVVVSLNHRLNILGYLDLSAYGEEYANSANAGNDDIIAALRWIHDNIAAFGGDPENVTLFGQSGGGAKIWMLMQMPEADGLFHKAVVQSGVVGGANKNGRPKLDAGAYDEPMDGRPLVEALLKELGLDNAKQLEAVPYDELTKAYNKVAPALREAGQYVSGPMPNAYYVGDPRVCGFTAHAQTIPVLVGTVLDEFAAFSPTPDEEIEKDGRGVIARKFGETHADELIALYQKTYPGKGLRDLADIDTLFREPTVDFIEKRARQCAAPTYSYLLTFDFEAQSGSGPWHCAEIPFVFHNAAMTPYCNVPGGEALETAMCDAWLAFARSGDPSCAALPAWPACKPGDEACMIFDQVCELRHNHDHALLALLDECEEAPAEDVKVEH